MRREFGLGDVMITLCHRHGKKDLLKGRVNNSRGNSFNEGVKTVEMKNGQNSIRELSE